MALRCYNCGNEPGEAESCVACGAPQTITPVGMFTLRPDIEATTADVASPMPTAPRPGNPGNPDIVDAAVVEDGVVVEPVPAPVAATPSAPPPPPTAPPVSPAATAPTAPPPYVATESSAPPPAPAPEAPTVSATPAEPTRHTLGSIFRGRPTPSEAHDPMRSPFGQHATPPAPAAVPEVAEPAPNGSAPKVGIFSAGQVEEPPPGAPESPARAERTAPSGPPPAFARAVPAGSGPEATVAGAPASATARSNPTLPDAHGLAASVARLSSASQMHGLVPFSIAGALLGSNERVLGAVAGTSLGMPTVVVVTETRALVVSDRRYVPDVEIFELGNGLTVHGRHANEQASLTFGDGDRLVTVDQIADVGLAVELANTARTRTTHGEF